MESVSPDHKQYDPAANLENIRNGIREITHGINNPLGIIRMAVYFLQTTNPTGEKREHYFKIIDEGMGRIEQSIEHLKMLRENPSIKIQDNHPL